MNTILSILVLLALIILTIVFIILSVNKDEFWDNFKGDE